MPAVPAVKRHIRAVFAVRLQNLPHKQEEIQEPALLESLPDGNTSFSLAKMLVLNMGMGDAGVGRGTVGIQGDHNVAARSGKLIPSEHNPEPAQIDAFQGDKLGDRGKRPFFQIALDFLELLCERDQVLRDLTHAGRRGWPVWLCNFSPTLLQFSNEVRGGTVDLTAASGRRS